MGYNEVLERTMTLSRSALRRKPFLSLSENQPLASAATSMRPRAAYCAGCLGAGFVGDSPLWVLLPTGRAVLCICSPSPWDTACVLLIL